MRKYLICLGLILAIALPKLYSQDLTYGHQEESKMTGPKVLLIPFEPNLFFTNIGKELCHQDDISFVELRSKFRSAMDRNLFVSLKNQNFHPVSLYQLPTSESHKEQRYIFSSIAYKYKSMPKDEMEVKHKNFSNKLKNLFKKNDEKKKSTRKQAIENGQLTSAQPDFREKFMEVEITNPRLFNKLYERYDTQYFLFVSQIDVNKIAVNQFSSGEENSNQRELKVHYTLFDKAGKRIASGAKKVLFSSHINDLKEIFRKELGLISNTIVAELVKNK